MLSIDYRDGRPIYEQIADSLERMAVCGALEPDAQLPSVRQLAMELSINPNTIQRAYGELERRGVAYAVKGKGSFIAPDSLAVRTRRLSELEGTVRKAVREAHELGAPKETIAEWIRTELEGGSK